MRIITSESIEAFYNRGNFKKGNRKVVSNETLTTLYLHNNAIARLSLAGQLMISNAGWSSNITKECLNGLKGVHVKQKNWVWYLNGEEWSGEWTEISA